MGDKAPSGAPLCDGLPHIRLWVLVEPMLSREYPGSQVRVENGVPFLTIDGSCDYWVSGGWMEDSLSRDRGARRGTLAAMEAREVEQSVPLNDVAVLGDCAPVAGQADVSVRTIVSAKTPARCPTTGARFDAAWSSIQALANTLWQRGEPMDGPIHVSAVGARDGAAGMLPYSWPLAMSLGSFVVDPGKDGSNLATPGISRLVTELSSTKSLRTLRDQYLTDRGARPGLYVSWDGLKVTDSVDTVLVYFRDAIPYEDASGLLQF
jgi:hypothetical protein